MTQAESKNPPYEPFWTGQPEPTTSGRMASLVAEVAPEPPESVIPEWISNLVNPRIPFGEITNDAGAYQHTIENLNTAEAEIAQGQPKALEAARLRERLEDLRLPTTISELEALSAQLSKALKETEDLLRKITDESTKQTLQYTNKRLRKLSVRASHLEQLKHDEEAGNKEANELLWAERSLAAREWDVKGALASQLVAILETQIEPPVEIMHYPRGSGSDSTMARVLDRKTLMELFANHGDERIEVIKINAAESIATSDTKKRHMCRIYWQDPDIGEEGRYQAQYLGILIPNDPPDSLSKSIWHLASDPDRLSLHSTERLAAALIDRNEARYQLNLALRNYEAEQEKLARRAEYRRQYAKLNDPKTDLDSIAVASGIPLPIPKERNGTYRDNIFEGDEAQTNLLKPYGIASLGYADNYLIIRFDDALPADWRNLTATHQRVYGFSTNVDGSISAREPKSDFLPEDYGHNRNELHIPIPVNGVAHQTVHLHIFGQHVFISLDDLTHIQERTDKEPVRFRLQTPRLLERVRILEEILTQTTDPKAQEAAVYAAIEREYPFPDPNKTTTYDAYVTVILKRQKAKDIYDNMMGWPNPTQKDQTVVSGIEAEIRSSMYESELLKVNAELDDKESKRGQTILTDESALTITTGVLTLVGKDREEATMRQAELQAQGTIISEFQRHILLAEMTRKPGFEKTPHRPRMRKILQVLGFKTQQDHLSENKPISLTLAETLERLLWLPEKELIEHLYYLAKGKPIPDQRLLITPGLKNSNKEIRLNRQLPFYIHEGKPSRLTEREKFLARSEVKFFLNMKHAFDAEIKKAQTEQEKAKRIPAETSNQNSSEEDMQIEIEPTIKTTDEDENKRHIAERLLSRFWRVPGVRDVRRGWEQARKVARAGDGVVRIADQESSTITPDQVSTDQALHDDNSLTIAQLIEQGRKKH